MRERLSLGGLVAESGQDDVGDDLRLVQPDVVVGLEGADVLEVLGRPRADRRLPPGMRRPSLRARGV
jgi:hypothetical protein